MEKEWDREKEMGLTFGSQGEGAGEGGGKGGKGGYVDSTTVLAYELSYMISVYP